MSFALKSVIVCLVLLQLLAIANARSNKQRRHPVYDNAPERDSEWSENRKGWKKSSHGNRTKEGLNEETSWNAQGLQSHGRSHNRNHESDHLDQEESSYDTAGRVNERGWGRHTQGTGEIQQIFRHRNRRVKRVFSYNN